MTTTTQTTQTTQTTRTNPRTKASEKHQEGLFFPTRTHKRKKTTATTTYQWGKSCWEDYK